MLPLGKKKTAFKELVSRDCEALRIVSISGSHLLFHFNFVFKLKFKKQHPSGCALALNFSQEKDFSAEQFAPVWR
jgi:hypothetical protein